MARGSVGKILPASCRRGEENFPPSFSAFCAHAQPMCVETRPHGRSPLSDGAIRSMTLSSVLYEALRPRVGSHILHVYGARIYEYDWVRSGFIETPSCRRHTTPPLSHTSWAGRRRHTRMEGAHRCYLLTKQSRSVKRSIAWHTRRSAASLSRCTDSFYEATGGNGCGKAERRRGEGAMLERKRRGIHINTKIRLHHNALGRLRFSTARR